MAAIDISDDRILALRPEMEQQNHIVVEEMNVIGLSQARFSRLMTKGPERNVA